MGNIKDSILGIAEKIGARGPHYRCFNSAIIVAGGSGIRASGDSGTKQLREVAGVPVVARTVNVFESCHFISEIIIVAREDELGLYGDFIKKYGWTKVSRVVAGGTDRRASVFNGFKCISDKSDYVFIHDAARCLITVEMIDAVARDVCKYGAACASSLAKDSVKTVDEKGFITENVDRDTVRCAQTPQAFKTELYRAAAYVSLESDLKVTDDCSLVENIGYKIKLTDCGSENIKITYPEDFDIAEAILAYREKKKSENI